MGYKAYTGPCPSVFTFSWGRQASPPLLKKTVQVNKNICGIAKGSTKILPHEILHLPPSLFLIP